VEKEFQHYSFLKPASLELLLKDYTLTAKRKTDTAVGMSHLSQQIAIILKELQFYKKPSHTWRLRFSFAVLGHALPGIANYQHQCQSQ